MPQAGQGRDDRLKFQDLLTDTKVCLVKILHNIDQKKEHMLSF